MEPAGLNCVNVFYKFLAGFGRLPDGIQVGKIGLRREKTIEHFYRGEKFMFDQPRVWNRRAGTAGTDTKRRAIFFMLLMITRGL